MPTDEPLSQLSPAKRALYEIRSLKEKIAELERQQHEPIAIIGMGLRFPGNASSPEEFWEVLSQRVDAVSEIPFTRWPIEQFYNSDADAPGKMYARHGAFLQDPLAFDADFFGISPREAESLDPQHRLALEVAWEALENAGCNPAGLNGTAAGVFLGLSNSDYARMVFRDAEGIDAYSSIGNTFSAAAGRISYLLGLSGPALVVDTACSSSLVAIHLACESLRKGECRMALAGGVNLILSPEVHINFSKSRMMARDGKCKTFDASADGYVRGEGCGIVVLKRLSQAESDGDRILALIRGSAVNQDGRSSGMTAPNGTAQEALLRQALQNAGVAPADISYIETHGTGTSLGDPIEAHALAAVLKEGRTPEHPLILGALKSNIGHLESAAGVAGIIKAVLALEHQQIPRNLHFAQMNPHIDWQGMPVHMPTEPLAWPRGARKRFAGISAFGFSGTNAHIVLEESPLSESTAPSPAPERPWNILSLAAQSQPALDRLEKLYANELIRPQAALADICFTANTGRAALAHRAVFLGSTAEQMLKAPLRGVKEQTPEIVFLFPGQGAQFAGMGRDLYLAQPVFRSALEECAEILKNELAEPLLEVLWGHRTALLDRTEYTQPALFAIEYALATLWQSWGLKPAAVLGHSVGEYAAACMAGWCSLTDGLRLIARRARLMQSVKGPGAMTAVFANEAAVRQALQGLEAKLSIAALNSPENVVISGDEEALAIAEARLAGVRLQRLQVSHAFHSAQMEEIVEEFAQAAAQVRWQEPRLQLISSVTGKPVRSGELSSPDYWRKQVRQPVHFQAAIESLMEAVPGHKVFVEVGPGTTLATLGRQCVSDPELLWAPSLRKGQNEWEQMLASLGQLYVRGAEVDWRGFDAPYTRRRVALPTYPFQRQRYWLPAQAAAPVLVRDADSEWRGIEEALTCQSRQGRLNLNIAEYPQRWACLDKLTTAYIIAAFQKLGLFQKANEQHTVADLLNSCGIRPTYEKLLGRWLRRLGNEGRLTVHGGGDSAEFTAVKPLPEIDVTALVSEASQVFGSDRILLDWVISCGVDLVEILTGKKNALETIFPGGTFSKAEDIYERAPLSAYFGSLGRAALDGFLRAGSQSALNILEIGAGTGSTTSALLPILPASATAYHFTDVSDVFLNHAERKFAAYPFVRFGRFDVERDPAEQGFQQGSFDVVVATNVLHATADIRQTLATVRGLLAPGGIALICETTSYLSWYDVTTGLIEGWQLFADGLRADHPLLPVETWTSLLQAAGFDRVLAKPTDDSPAQILGQHVIVARATPSATGVSQRPVPVQTVASSHQRRAIEIPPAAVWADLPAGERHEHLVAMVRAHLADMLRFDSIERIDRKRRLMDLGLDSLMAVELGARLTSTLGLEKRLSATLVFDYPTLDALADHLENDVLQLNLPPAADGTAATHVSGAAAARAEEIEQLNDDEVEALLLKKLQSL